MSQSKSVRDISATNEEAGAVEEVSIYAGPFTNLYLKFAMKSFQKQLAYKFEYFVGVLNGFLFIFIFTSLWRAIYEGAESTVDTGFNLNSIIAYAIFAMVIRISMSMDDMSTIGKVRSGAIALDLLKPMNYFLMMLSESLGQSMFHWFTRVIPILAVCLILFDVSMPVSVAHYALFFAAWGLGYFIMFMINFLFGLIAFWTIETFSFQLMKYGLYTLFAGGIVPIDFFPDWARPVADILPFKYVLYVPTSFIIGHIGGVEALKLLAIQALWVVGLGVMSWMMWSAARRKLVVQGG
jgi:ABC-2 type transport system permease protein